MPLYQRVNRNMQVETGSTRGTVGGRGYGGWSYRANTWTPKPPFAGWQTAPFVLAGYGGTTYPVGPWMGSGNYVYQFNTDGSILILNSNTTVKAGTSAWNAIVSERTQLAATGKLKAPSSTSTSTSSYPSPTTPTTAAAKAAADTVASAPWYDSVWVAPAAMGAALLLAGAILLWPKGS